MTKKSALLIVLLASISLGGCKGNNDSSSSSSFTSSLSSQVTGIDILGPKRVEVGKNIRLVYEVKGNKNETATWSSLNLDVATIDKDGKITGLKEGTCTIKATCDSNANIYATYEIIVFKPKAESLKIVINDSDVSYDALSNTFSLPLGRRFEVEVLPTSENSAHCDSYSFQVVYPSGAEYSNYVIIETSSEEINKASILCLDEAEGLALKVVGKYLDSATGDLITSSYLNVIDENKEFRESLNNNINSLMENEANLVSADISFKKVNKDLKENKQYSKEETITHNSYQNVSLVNKEIKENNNGNEVSYKENIFNGLHNDNYFFFSYDENNNVKEVYKNEDKKEENSSNSNYYPAFILQSPVYGFTNLLNLFNTSSAQIDSSIVSLGNIYCYANSEYNLTNEEWLVTSSYVDLDTNYKYDVRFYINVVDNKLVSFSFKEKVVSENEEKEYIMEGSNFVYGTKKAYDKEVINYLDIDNYYLDSFTLTELKGEKTDAYDYSNLKKYGSDSVSEVEGIKKYTLSYNKVLVFKVDDILPKSASTKIDILEAESSDSEQIPNISIIGDAPITISPKKDDNNLAMPGIATFTFKTIKGFTYSIIVEFISYPVRDIIISNTPSDNTFEPIFQGRNSSYFYINTDPDEDRYTFGIEILKGPIDGLEIYKYQDDNRLGIPGFAYAVKGLKVGSYDFKIYVNEKDSVKSEDTYHIEVLEPYSDAYLKEVLVDSNKVYEINGETLKMELKFVSETQAMITQTYSYGETRSVYFNYKIANSYLIVEEAQTFTNFYFSKIFEGEIYYSNNLEEISLILEIYDESALPEVDSYYYASFKLQIDKANLVAYLNGKTLISEVFVVGLGMCKFQLSFLENHGEVAIYKNSNSELIGNVAFDFNYDNYESKLKIYNASNANEDWKLDLGSYSLGDYKETRGEITLDFLYQNNKVKVNFAI